MNCCYFFVALKEFKQRFVKIMTQQSASAKDDNLQMPELPDRIKDVLMTYSEGLKQIVVKGHPWVVNDWAKRQYNEKEALKGSID